MCKELSILVIPQQQQQNEEKESNEEKNREDEDDDDEDENNDEIAVRETDVSLNRKSYSNRWSKSKAQYAISGVDQMSSTSLSPNNTNSFHIPRYSDNSSIPPINKSEGTDVVSLYSSEDPQLSGFKSTSSVVKSHEPENLEDLVVSNSDVKIPIPSYTGSEEFVYLSVSDNLEKYFTEQVFGYGRPSGEAPYMRYEIINGYNRNINGYIEAPFQQERIVALYREKSVEIHQESVIPKANSPDKSKKKSSKIKSQPQTQQSQSQSLKPYVFVLTDINFYVIIDNFSSLQKFVDAPIPLVKRIHPIENCR